METYDHFCPNAPLSTACPLIPYNIFRATCNKNRHGSRSKHGHFQQAHAKSCLWQAHNDIAPQHVSWNSCSSEPHVSHQETTRRNSAVNCPQSPFSPECCPTQRRAFVLFEHDIAYLILRQNVGLIVLQTHVVYFETSVDPEIQELQVTIAKSFPIRRRHTLWSGCFPETLCSRGSSSARRDVYHSEAQTQTTHMLFVSWFKEKSRWRRASAFVCESTRLTLKVMMRYGRWPWNVGAHWADQPESFYFAADQSCTAVWNPLIAPVSAQPWPCIHH